MPGAGGLDDAVQVVVEDAATSTARTYTLLRDELGTVMGLVAEDEGSDPSNSPVPVRYRYTPYGEAHAESGPELLRAHFDGQATEVQTAGGTTTQTVADETAAAAGLLVLDWALPLDSATLPAGLTVERLATGTGWVPLPAEEVAVGTAPSGGTSAGGGGPSARLLVLARSGWLRGTSYRVRLTGGLTDELGRRFGRTESLEWRVPEASAVGSTPAVTFDKKIATRFESWEAAKDDLSGRFPGGQTALFQGLWTDPVTGIAYARARWYDARNASWLSEDPLLDIDSPNLYAFVGHAPNMEVDPLGLVKGAKTTSVEKPVPCAQDPAYANEDGPHPAEYCPNGWYVTPTVTTQEYFFYLPEQGVPPVENVLETSAQLHQTGMSDEDASIALALLYPGDQPPTPLMMAVAKGTQTAKPVVDATWTATKLFLYTVGAATLAGPGAPVALDLAEARAAIQASAARAGAAGTIRAGSAETTLFEEFGVRPGNGLNLNQVSGAEGRSYITYAFRNSSGEVVYVGRASGPGTPAQVLQQRLTKGHDHFLSGYKAEVVDVQSSRLASQGAEEFFIQGYREQGAQLQNVDPALSFGSRERTGKSLNKLDAFFEDLFARKKGS